MKQIIITVPDNCELKQDGNNYTIFEKEKKVTYEDIRKELSSESHIKQCKKLRAINQLMYVAKYLNGDWQPNWNNYNECKYYIYCDNDLCSRLRITCNTLETHNAVYFKSKELAQQAIEILGEETIKLALCTDY